MHGRIQSSACAGGGSGRASSTTTAGTSGGVKEMLSRSQNAGPSGGRPATECSPDPLSSCRPRVCTLNAFRATHSSVRPPQPHVQVPPKIAHKAENDIDRAFSSTGVKWYSRARLRETRVQGVHGGAPAKDAAREAQRGWRGGEGAAGAVAKGGGAAARARRLDDCRALAALGATGAHARLGDLARWRGAVEGEAGRRERGYACSRDEGRAWRCRGGVAGAEPMRTRGRDADSPGLVAAPAL
ncbi:hypothetical protein DFH09DRAFT_1288675 [Mycena vulgaris]|nr:hypothetical protein DFH09DRAFT_1288675 [Mycena vulgaris]